MLSSRSFVVGLAALVLVGSSSTACAPAAVKPAVVADPDSMFEGDQDVPLVAPDEAPSRAANPRLTSTKTIGDDGASYDLGGASRNGGQPTGAPRASTLGPSPRYRTGFRLGRGSAASASTASAGGVSGAAPAVGGNFAAPPSFGPAAAR